MGDQEQHCTQKQITPPKHFLYSKASIFALVLLVISGLLFYIQVAGLDSQHLSSKKLALIGENESSAQAKVESIMINTKREAEVKYDPIQAEETVAFENRSTKKNLE